ncbi:MULTISPECIES: putative bifunctional diguanylate cyclase/phosphodiesterase [unclassified Solwaraspora]|uniref:putative bifunctional diguanylate cyclase/phosphodiesterase n=1 Tax=unclassified Solwaraspora TaxID=2627926 RepID=UPI00259B5C69|nr:bifunctional diguanylate cyclase/phosphodiesterase [Solwaraspora sp. WMMA2056]WJK41788.1 bifunctional diguanylate cyclase/phosphodiesterase [Solwaraspora sp. WMMA2056]
MTRTVRRDIETDRQLLLLVGLVAVCAATVGIASLVLVAGSLVTTPDQFALVAALVFLAAVGVTVQWHVRIRSTAHAIAWSEVAILVGLAVAPATLVLLCTGLGVGLVMIVQRVARIKATFAVAKNMLLAAAAGGVLHALNWDLAQPISSITFFGPLAGAYVVAVVLDEVLTLPVIARATRTRLRVMFRQDLGLRISSAVIRFPLILATLLILKADQWLLVTIPPVVLCIHLAYAGQARSRADQQAWQRLARATDALNVIDLDVVLSTAVVQAADLFSTDRVEVELNSPHRLVQGNSDGVQYDGPADTAPTPHMRTVIAVPLASPDSTVSVGTLRLCLAGPVKFSDREHYTLRTFASALCTAVRNATLYQQLNEEAERHARQAAQDSLTGLANRRRLMDHGAQLLGGRRTGGITALLLIDLNHFKEINDTLGHAAGDEVLIQVARRLCATAHAGDMVARLGGDEFAVLLTGLPAPAIATHRADALLAAICAPMDLDGMRINVEASGGIAVAPGNGGMPELLRRADVAMYQAKRSGGRIASYARGRDTADVGRLALGGDLPRAVAEHEFSVAFQPIVDLGTGEVIAAEALARWQHPDQGRLDPPRFLDTVERSGLLPAFADAVLDQSLIAAATWAEAGFALPVAVNLSPRSLLDPRYPSAVLARLRAHDIPPSRLVLELTETLTISQLEVVDQVLGQLRDAGIRLALDEFGTGYSSLSMLSRVPVHELKIARSFVRSMETSAEAVAVIRSTVDLGRSLGLAVVAEGVESEPQRQALWALGCTAGQGHLFARPMPAHRLLTALQCGSGGRPGSLAGPLHDEGAVIRLDQNRRAHQRQRTEKVPHLPA